VKTSGKIVSVSTLKKKVREARKRGMKVAFTNGCFDLLHSGHVSYLEAAARPGQILVVALNSDKSVRSIKGPRRPIVNQQGRCRVMAALGCVDFVTVFEEDTPYELIKRIKPDVLVKGADWKDKPVIGADIVRGLGGRVRLVKCVPDQSTTNIIAEVLKKCRP
jgi:D-beta-D-heptose 7-phosphate kinase/D-beta-D-heptose 1-phosphate adenosyltransferase